MNSHSKTSLHSTNQTSTENNDIKKAIKRTNSIVNNANNSDANHLSVETKPVFSKSLANKIANARAKAASNSSSMNYVDNSSEIYQNVSNIVKHANQIQQANSKKNSLTNSTNHLSSNNHNSNNKNNHAKPNSVAQNDHSNSNVNSNNKQTTPTAKNDNIINTTSNKSIKTNNLKINSNKKN